MRIRRQEEEEAETLDKKGDSDRMAVGLHNLIIETAGTEEKAAEGLGAALEMEFGGEGEGEGEEGGDGAIWALGALEFLTQDAEPSGTTLVDARNEINKLSRLAMLWTVRYRWPVGVRFPFNCYRHWAQLLLRQPGEPPVTILSREGVTQGDPLTMVLYGINLIPLAKELRAADLGLLSPFHADDAAFGGSTRQSAHLLKLLMRRGLDHGCFPKPDKSLFILGTLG